MDSYDNKAIGERIRSGREAKELTQTKLAKRLGWANSKICKIEDGTQELKISELFIIAKELDLTVEHIVGLHSRKSLLMKMYENFRDFFGAVTTTSDYSGFFKTDKEYIVLPTDKFRFLSAIIKAESLPSTEIQGKVKAAIEEYNKSERTVEKCYLITEKQIDEIIAQAVIDQHFVKAKFAEFEKFIASEDFNDEQSKKINQYTADKIKEYFPYIQQKLDNKKHSP
jgi:transcriptional regulator with XRE-family HTH domain